VARGKRRGVSPKLTGWLASLDLAAPTQRLIRSHRTASPHALYDVLVLDGGMGKPINDLVDSDRKLPVNLGRFHLIIPGNQKTEFRNPRLNSRPLLPFNQLGFDRIRSVVKHNGSQQQVL